MSHDATQSATRETEDLVAGRAVHSSDPGLPFLLMSHGLSGLASIAIEQGTLHVAPETAANIRQDWRFAIADNKGLDALSRTIAESAHTENLATPIVVKGASIAGRYPDTRMRNYCDLDLLVPARERTQWHRLLTALDLHTQTATPPTGRYSHEIPYRMRTEGTVRLCELHLCLCMERRARALDYEAFLALTEPGPFPYTLRLRADAQLLAVALSWVHHQKNARRLMAIRDVFELADDDTVAGARTIAARFDVSWALERILAEAERIAGRAIWAARYSPPKHFGLERVQEMDRPGALFHFALARELGTADGARYLLSRVNPRRFTDPDSFAHWSRRAWATLRATDWRDALRKKTPGG